MIHINVYLSHDDLISALKIAPVLNDDLQLEFKFARVPTWSMVLENT
jgi:hypothetical protein